MTAEQAPEDGTRWTKAEAPTWVSVTHGWGVFEDGREWYVALCRNEADADRIIRDHDAAAALGRVSDACYCVFDGDEVEWSPSCNDMQHRINYYAEGWSDCQRQRDDAAAALALAKAHIDELEEAWRRGVIDEHDGKGGTRSNRNVEVRVMLADTLRRIDEANAASGAKPSPGTSPASGNT